MGPLRTGWLHCWHRDCHSKSADLADAVRRADILVAAVGRPALIRCDWITPGAVVIEGATTPGPSATSTTQEPPRARQ